MSLVESLLPEFDREMGVTRRLLERVPDGQFAWKPHEKSMTLGRLAEHLAEMPHWCTATLTEKGVDAAKARPEGYQPPATRDAVLAMFDKNLAAARTALVGRADPELMVSWSLTFEGREIFTMPRIAVLRGFVMNHMIHHRGQLSVYLRLQDVPLPSIYGPSADEQA